MLKVGVIGIGNLGKSHIKLLKEIDGLELVGVYGSNYLDEKGSAKRLKVKHFSSVDELIDRVDAVGIMKSSISYFDCAVSAIKRSKHVFIEKPVTKTVEEAKRLLGLAEEANVKVQVGNVERFNPAFKVALPHISNPRLIETHRMMKFDTGNSDMSVVMDLMSHDLDIVLSIVNSNIKKISASGVEVVGGTPDIVNAVVEFDNGCIANLTASRVALKNEHVSRIYQQGGHIKVDYLKQETSLSLVTSNGKAGINSKKLKIKKENPVKTELEEFAQSIYNNTPPKVGIHDGGVMIDAANRVMEKMKITTSLI